MQLILGDCLEQLALMPDACVDAIVTDPPYGLTSKRPGGRSEATRGAVMGGFMGLEWDSGVPSVDIWRECLRVLKPGGHLLAFAGTRTQHRMAVNIEDAGFEIRDMIAWCYGSGFPKSHNLKGDWEGWGTALKPALEPITLARKPFKGTVAQNVLEHGTGGINIDGCRVEASEALVRPAIYRNDNAILGTGLGVGVQTEPPGRWPANLIHDGSEEVAQLFPFSKDGVAVNRNRDGEIHNEIYGAYRKPPGEDVGYGGGGSAARFFYCAKASKADREDGNVHPTVKPTDLMAYLCRLVTPPGGVVLDPFMGSGSTGKAAIREGFGFIGIEREAEYFAIAQQRVQLPEQQQLSLVA